MKLIKVLFLLPYPLQKAPSQRFRVELFLPLLEKHNIKYDISCFLDNKIWSVIYKPGNVFKKVTSVLKGFARRFKDVFIDVHQYDYIFIHREASPIGPPVFEFIISKIWRKKIIYDFDDAIWISNTSKENKLVSWIKAFWKIKFLCKWSYTVVGGNEYLCNYARHYNDKVVLIPTCVDTLNSHNRLKVQETNEVVIGWTGSHSTMHFLNSISSILQNVVNEYGVSIIIISNKEPEFKFHGIHYIPWNEITEVEDLLKINIGLMPLETDPWCEGKCGFKLIQYLSLGIPAIASPVGVNKYIIEHGINGFLASSESEWYHHLVQLINNETLRVNMGKNGREKINEYYSIQANEGLFIGLFN